MENKQATAGPHKDAINPKAKANFLSTTFFCWALPTLVKGFKKDLVEDDLWGKLKDHESKRLGDKLEIAWTQEKNYRENPSLLRVLIKIFGKELAFYGIHIFLVEFIIKLSQPLFIGKLLEYYTPNQTTISKDTAYIYAGLIVLMNFINVLIGHSSMFGLFHLGMKIRVACCSLLYRKSLKLSQSALVDTTVGQMVNLLSNDVNRFDMSMINIHHMWTTPIQTGLVMYLLYANLGASALVGMTVLLSFIPLQMYLGKVISGYRLRTALRTDHRVRLMNEIICGIQVIKMYTWEKPFEKLVELARKLEIKQIRSNSWIRALNTSFLMFLNKAAIFLCILTYVLTGNTLHSQYVYVLTSFYGTLRHSVCIFFPQGVALFAETKVSVKRIQKFLLLDEIQNKQMVSGHKTENKKNELSLLIDGEISGKIARIKLDKACVKWAETSTDYTLTDVNMDIGPTDLVAVVGPVGTGKTTLLQVILKELPLISGSLDISGRVSYASQEPWLFGGSVRQNIVFGETYDAQKYKEVVKVCALERDFSLFPYGDQTIVGERGTTLSGGQRARINLARAVYKDADIYLLDDPLSAVDTHVGKQLFDDCIVEYLRNKCVVLVTHQLQYLQAVDRIYLLENGTVSYSGTYNELKDIDNEYLQRLEGEKEDKEQEPKVTNPESKTKSSESLEKTAGPVEIKEQRSTGKVSSKVYFSYVKAGGNACSSLAVAMLFLLVQITDSISEYFLSFWVNLEQVRLEESVTNTTSTANNLSFFISDNCLYIYSGLVGFGILMTLGRSLNFFRFCMKASRVLHNRMFSSVVNASMRFFNVNSSGRILNRFSKDMGSVDEVLPAAIMDTMQIGLITLAINIIIAVTNVWIIIPSVIIFGFLYFLRVIYLATSRDVKRLEGTTRSPVFSHMTATLQGLTTIRAFGAEDILKLEFDQHQDLHSCAFFMFLACNRTFGFWLDLHCVIYIAIVTMSYLFIGDEMYGGNVGLGITQAIMLTGMLQWGMRQWSELENQMTSVERVVEYTEIPPERDDATQIPNKLWPADGNVEFRSVSMRYAEEDPFVLQNLSFTVKAAEKVGIVGRTGAGKSSLISALFRLAEIEGSIVIDGINTKKISLENLRSKISIIPQEPVLFSGTLRKNLDPFDEYNDEALWDALEEVELKSSISDNPSGLQTNISEGGSNFSVGQRQLLCLARAVVRSNKVLVMDEATANVDPQTDELIQRTIRRKFRDCTVFTIAHRLHTVMDSDKILVMEAGHAAEFDQAHVLLQNTNGIFYGLVEQTGKAMADSLKRIAEENYRPPPDVPAKV